MGAGGSPRANTGPQSPHMGLWGAILGAGVAGAHPGGRGLCRPILGPGAAGAHPKGQGATGAYPGGRGLRGPILGAGPGLRGACCKLCGGQEKGVTETWPCGL